MKLRIYLIFFLILSGYSFAQSSHPINKKLFLGKWKSSSDKNYTMVVNDSLITEYYAKDITTKLAYKIDGDKLTEFNKEDKEEFHYSIIILDNKRLELLYLDRGNTLRFIK